PQRDLVRVAVRQPVLGFEILDDLAVLRLATFRGDGEPLVHRLAGLGREVRDHRGHRLFGGFRHVSTSRNYSGQFSVRVRFGESGSSSPNSRYKSRTPNDGRPVSTTALSVLTISFPPWAICLAVLVAAAISSIRSVNSTPSGTSRSS